MKLDTIIVGSGLGGLVCALLLARQGQKVIVLEKHTQPGGCMQSFHRHGASFDTGLHYVGGLAPGQPLYKEFKDLGLLDLSWQRLDSEAFDEITICGKTYKFAEGYGNFVETLAKEFPDEREGLEKYVLMLQSKDEYWLQNTNAYSFLTSIIHDPLLISVLGGSSLKMELNKDTLPLFTFAHGNASFIESSWRLKGSGNILVHKLIEQIRDYGGDVLTNAEVTGLVEADGLITKAVCRDGREFEAESFITDIHPALTVSLVKESQKIKRVFRRRITALKNTYGMYTLQLLLKPGTLKYFNHNKFVYSQQDIWGDIAVNTEKPTVRGIMISCPVPAEEEAEVIDILTPMEWSFVERWADMAPGHRGEDYVVMKKEINRQCISLAETVLPGLSEMIVAQHTSTPLTYYTYNAAPEGTAYGVRKDYSDSLGTILSPTTPVPNLFMTGQSLMLHGVHGVIMTSHYTCSKINKNEENTFSYR